MSEPITAAAAIAADGVPDLPRETPRSAPSDLAAPAAAPAPMVQGSAPAGPARLDSAGAAFDPALHEVGPGGEPRMRQDGRFALKRGNGARRRAGLPPAGNAGAGFPGRPPKPKPKPAASEPSHPTPPQVAAAPSPAASAAEPAPVSDVRIPEVEPPSEAEADPPADPADYRETAEALTEGQFGGAQIAFGAAWEPRPSERSAWIDAWAKALAHYQAPKAGPLLRLIILAVCSVAKRRGDAETRATLGRWWSALRRRRQPAPPEPAPAADHQEPEPEPAQIRRGVFS